MGIHVWYQHVFALQHHPQSTQGQLWHCCQSNRSTVAVSHPLISNFFFLFSSLRNKKSSFLKRISFFTKRKRIFIPVFWRLSLRPEFSCRKVFVLPAPNLGDKEQDSPYPMLCEEGGGYFLLEMTTQSKGGALGVAKEERRDIYAIQVMKMKRIMLIWVSEDVF